MERDGNEDGDEGGGGCPRSLPRNPGEDPSLLPAGPAPGEPLYLPHPVPHDQDIRREVPRGRLRHSHLCPGESASPCTFGAQAPGILLCSHEASSIIQLPKWGQCGVFDHYAPSKEAHPCSTCLHGCNHPHVWDKAPCPTPDQSQALHSNGSTGMLCLCLDLTLSLAFLGSAQRGGEGSSQKAPCPPWGDETCPLGWPQELRPSLPRWH